MSIVQAHKVNSENLKKAGNYIYKYVYQQLNPVPRGEANLVFLAGCHRSGTTVSLSTLGRPKDTWKFHPDQNLLFDNKKLRSPEQIRENRLKAKPQFVIGKPLQDVHKLKEYLEFFPDLKLIWIYRNYNDVVRSAGVKWNDHQKDLMRRFSGRKWEHLKWRGEGTSEHFLSLVDKYYHPQMSAETGGALWWYNRNLHFFEQGLDRHQRVKMVKYEDLMSQPEIYYRELFRWVGIDFRPWHVEHIRSSSIRKEQIKTIDPGVARKCDALYTRLNKAYKLQRP